MLWLPGLCSNVWEAPEDMSLAQAEHHDHSKANPHNLSSVPRFTPINKMNSGESSCHGMPPDQQLINSMYAPHRTAAVASMGAAAGDAVVLFGGDLE